MNEFEFEAGVTCSFITPILDGVELFFIAEYDIEPAESGQYLEGRQITPDYDASVEVTNIKPASDKPTKFELAMCAFLNDMQDFEHLENDIVCALSDSAEDEKGDYLYQLMKDNKLEMSS